MPPWIVRRAPARRLAGSAAPAPSAGGATLTGVSPARGVGRAVGFGARRGAACACPSSSGGSPGHRVMRRRISEQVVHRRGQPVHVYRGRLDSSVRRDLLDRYEAGGVDPAGPVGADGRRELLLCCAAVQQQLFSVGRSRQEDVVRLEIAVEQRR
jgi:hypothetical protein